MLSKKGTAEERYIGKAILMLFPEMLEKLAPVIKRPVPVLIHFQLLPALFLRFCEIKELDGKQVRGVMYGQEATKHKILFIAVILKLYNPDLITGIHAVAMRSNLREELSRTLECNSTWISQQVVDIIRFLNPHKSLPVYDKFKNEVSKIVDVLEDEFKQQ